MARSKTDKKGGGYRGFHKVHFIGIGGIGMSGIAEVLINLNYEVSGSDLKKGEITERLKTLGAVIHYGHAAKNLTDADVVVVSNAVKRDNPEVVEAEARNIPVIPRAEMLAELMRMKYGVAVAGTHGKTTTTSMMATVFGVGNLDPTVVIGGKLDYIGSNAKLGEGEFLVAEADESDGSFLMLTPTIAVVTNIEEEHMDHYGSLEEIKGDFTTFINSIPFYGLSVLCLDNENVQAIIPEVKRRFVTYGFSPQADFYATGVTFEGLNSTFTVNYRGDVWGDITLHMPGAHNALNALSAVAVGMEVGLDFGTIQGALSGFTGVHRRFQVKGEAAGVTVVDDYGHHPTEITATLKAARNFWKGRVVAVFQPHRYTRTRDAHEGFLTAFFSADVLVMTDIYPAGEEPIPGITGQRLFDEIRERGMRDTHFVSDKEDLPKELMKIIRPGDLVITLGAGDILRAGERLLELLDKKQ
ncbi:MAG: UDP-N-acetylmuramate--L-alanine ligase [Deltaproteobacteria bacterium]|uniref:UDP-N-acetylmuramate--L-alanine ligase n=1 Tax=Candidatus Zymogenus saltonus TaxID=2844893 RepID=A0A9D8KFL9_9DELT|nr:UDP-N-acetylmuramate--L-alanine ligase [Candidatus Zymogenus saltonus]